ncbi:hypothetical protein [Paraburkholderia sprentiae]|nr:hypothetical protein [Paraburkholderia sprentiae]
MRQLEADPPAVGDGQLGSGCRCKFVALAELLGRESQTGFALGLRTTF